ADVDANQLIADGTFNFDGHWRGVDIVELAVSNLPTVAEVEFEIEFGGDAKWYPNNYFAIDPANNAYQFPVPSIRDSGADGFQWRIRYDHSVANPANPNFKSYTVRSPEPPDRPNVDISTAMLGDLSNVSYDDA